MGFSSRNSASRRQNDLADMRGALHALMRLPRLGERKHRIDNRLAAPGLEQRPDRLQESVGDLRLFYRRTGAERRAGVDEALLRYGLAAAMPGKAD